MKEVHPMAKEYTFEFPGTKESFLETIYQTAGGEGDFLYFDNYIIRLVGDDIRFGVERGGHSGGNWFIPVITESDNRTEFRGTVQYIGPGTNNNRSTAAKVMDWIGIILGTILFLPIILIILLCRMIVWCVKKIRKIPDPITTEDRLFDLMENRLGCKRVEIPHKIS